MLLWHCMKQTRVGRNRWQGNKRSQRKQGTGLRVDAGTGGKVEMIGLGGHQDEEEEGAVKRQTN